MVSPTSPSNREATKHNDPNFNRPPVEGKFNMENADRYVDPGVNASASGPGSGLGMDEGERARRTDAKIAENAARGLQSDSTESRAAQATGTALGGSQGGQGHSSSGVSGGQSSSGQPNFDRPPVEGQFNMTNADRYDDPSVDSRATGPGTGFGLAEGQQARREDDRLASQGQHSQSGQHHHHHSSTGQSGLSGQSGSTGSGLSGGQSSSGQPNFDRPPVEGKFNMENADRYVDPSVDAGATGPGTGFGLAEGQQARQTDARLASQGQGQQR